MESKIKYRRTSKGNYIGRMGRYYIFLRKRVHGRFDGFERACHWYSAYISINGKCIMGEGLLGSSLNTIKKAKDWVESKIKIHSNGK